MTEKQTKIAWVVGGSIVVLSLFFIYLNNKSKKSINQTIKPVDSVPNETDINDTRSDSGKIKMPASTLRYPKKEMAVPTVNSSLRNEKTYMIDRVINNPIGMETVLMLKEKLPALVKVNDRIIVISSANGIVKETEECRIKAINGPVINVTKLSEINLGTSNDLSIKTR